MYVKIQIKKRIKSANAQAGKRRLIAQIIKVHHSKGQENLLILIGLARKLYAELISTRKAFLEASIVYIIYLANFEIQVIEDMVLNQGAVAAPEAREKYAFLTVRALDSVEQLFVFSQNLYLSVCAGKLCSSKAPATDSKVSQNPSALVGDDYFIFEARHVLQATSNSCMKYLQARVAMATSWLNNFKVASNGRLQTQQNRARQSDFYLMYPFLLATLKLGSVQEMEYSLAPSQKQQKRLSRQSGVCSSRQNFPYSFPEPWLASLSSCRLFSLIMYVTQNLHYNLQNEIHTKIIVHNKNNQTSKNLPFFVCGCDVEKRNIKQLSKNHSIYYPKMLFPLTSPAQISFLLSNLLFLAIFFTTGLRYSTSPPITPSKIQLKFIRNLGPISYRSNFSLSLLTFSLKI